MTIRQSGAYRHLKGRVTAHWRNRVRTNVQKLDGGCVDCVAGRLVTGWTSLASAAPPSFRQMLCPAPWLIRSAGGKPEWRPVQLSMSSRFHRSLAGVVARKPEPLAGQASEDSPVTRSVSRAAMHAPSPYALGRGDGRNSRSCDLAVEVLVLPDHLVLRAPGRRMQLWAAAVPRAIRRTMPRCRRAGPARRTGHRAAQARYRDLDFLIEAGNSPGWIRHGGTGGQAVWPRRRQPQ